MSMGSMVGRPGSSLGAASYSLSLLGPVTKTLHASVFSDAEWELATSLLLIGWVIGNKSPHLPVPVFAHLQQHGDNDSTYPHRAVVKRK